uniref:F-box domain-containing protein n=1 Tax=Panagrellus redivivus TaxID=6233 RepID=A0A7E4W7R4_PANRE
MFCCLPLPKARAELPSNAHQRSQSRRTSNANALRLKRLAGLGISPLKRGLLAVVSKPLRRLRADRKSSMAMSPPSQRSSPPFLDLLPNEIVCSILQHVSPLDLDQCRLVNRRTCNLIDAHYKRLPLHQVEAIVSPDNAYITVSLLGAKVARTHIVRTDGLQHNTGIWKQRIVITRMVLHQLTQKTITVLEKLWLKQVLRHMWEIEFRGSNWHFLPLHLFKEVQRLKVVDLSCRSELSRLPSILRLCPDLKKLQLFGVECKPAEVERFLHAWTNITQPHIFDEVSLYFGVNSSNDSWKEYYPSFKYPNARNPEIVLHGTFGNCNSLKLNIGNETIPICESEKIQVLQNGLPVDFATMKYNGCLLSVTSPRRNRFFVNVCTSHPGYLRAEPATFTLCGTQHFVIRMVSPIPPTEPMTLHFEYQKALESRFSYVHHVFLDDLQYEQIHLPLQYYD